MTAAFACVLCPETFGNARGRGVHEGMMHPGVVPDHRVERRRLWERAYYTSDGYKERQRRRTRRSPAVAARNSVFRALRDGRLTRGPCEVCGATPTHGHHHRGYDHPLDVAWLCPYHHTRAHLEAIS